MDDHFTTNICRLFLKVIHDQKKLKYLHITWIKKILAWLTRKTSMNDHFTTNICQSFLKVNQEKTQKYLLSAYYMDEKNTCPVNQQNQMIIDDHFPTNICR